MKRLIDLKHYIDEYEDVCRFVNRTEMCNPQSGFSLAITKEDGIYAEIKLMPDEFQNIINYYKSLKETYENRSANQWA